MAKNEDAKTDDLALPSLKTTCENLGMGSWPAVGDRQQGGAGASALLPPFPNSVNALCSTFAAHARPASLESLLATSRAMLPLPSGLSSTSKGAASAHAASEEAEQNTGRPALMPGDFDASKIGRDPFVVKAIATGLCRLFPDMKSPYDAMIDVQLLASGLPTPWPPSTHSWQILEVHRVCVHTHTHTHTHAHTHTHTHTQVESCKNKPSTMKRNVDQCHILVRGPGMDRVKVRVWANGRTQTTGCKDRKMLVESNAVRAFVCMCIHTYIHACIHTCIHTYIHAYIHACMHAYIHTYIHHTCIHVHCVCMCPGPLMCVCVCACVCWLVVRGWVRSASPVQCVT